MLESPEWCNFKAWQRSCPNGTWVWCPVAQLEASNSEIERLSKYERRSVVQSVAILDQLLLLCQTCPPHSASSSNTKIQRQSQFSQLPFPKNCGWTQKKCDTSLIDHLWVDITSIFRSTRTSCTISGGPVCTNNLDHLFNIYDVVVVRTICYVFNQWWCRDQTQLVRCPVDFSLDNLPPPRPCLFALTDYRTSKHKAYFTIADISQTQHRQHQPVYFLAQRRQNYGLYWLTFFLQHFCALLVSFLEAQIMRWCTKIEKYQVRTLHTHCSLYQNTKYTF